MSLATYHKKRDFKKTPEPKTSGKSKKHGLTFVVQRHDASHLHYDFRLEMNGVLKSWAIPKGPSMDPKDKRLAVMVEDHPLSYGKFHGVIPEGNYGAGTVEIWDAGTYEPAEAASADPEKELLKELKKGSLKINLHGKKLKGSFALVQIKDDKQKNWLLIKHKDEHADETLESKAIRATAAPVRSVRSAKEKLTHFITPMLAQTKDKAFDDDGWLFEVKWDGYRAVAEVSKKEIKLYSRNGLSFLKLYEPVAKALEKIKDDVVLDGEIVVLDDNNKPSFQKLQHYDENRNRPLVYYVFDCLKHKGKDLTHLPLVERKKILEKLLPKSDVIRYSDHVDNDGTTFFNKVSEMGLEGMIAKKKDSTYASGKRTADWLKIKNQNTQEAVVAGFTAPRNSRSHFGALVLGVYEKGKLKYIGHTGTGFTEKLLQEIHDKLKPLIRKTSPFDEKIPVNSPVTWVTPEKVCQVKFTEITNDGILRHPVFMGLRVDKSAKEVDHVDVPAKTKSIKTPKKTASKKSASSISSSHTKANGAAEIRKVDGHELRVTHPGKIYFPNDHITKGDVIEYYNTIYPYIGPYLKDRPQSLKRNPNGIGDWGFFQKDAADAAPRWVDHIELYSESADKDIDYILCNNKATLLYLNNLGCIEINPWNSRVKKLDNPDYLILDIDPSDKNTFNEVIDAALAVKEVLDKAGASSYCKTSGASGLHVYVPLHAQYSYDHARDFSEIIARFAQALLPDSTTLERSLSKRKNRIYLDYLQNKRGQTLASVYSVRPVEGATVSTPLAWKEVKHGLHPSDFTLKNIGKRLARTGDLFAPVLKEKNNLNKCLKNLGA
ncbi:DNA ligase D [Chryseolinea lacunae]|uniref:DNA ligase (ATP) n=1 Tax=Chryseolinea lacunae TaxID=2801331 RepID=A0ABS1L056_9BACT|nr:DNA ligase D [Chryseolinea lacunae]MBL0745098.1 DNA ligase D [Chryseolinea lacunae]